MKTDKKDFIKRKEPFFIDEIPYEIDLIDYINEMISYTVNESFKEIKVDE